MTTAGQVRITALAAAGCLVLSASAAQASGTPTFVQEHYRWRNDNGSESAATWKTPVADTPIADVARHENIRLRFAVANTSTNSGSLIARLEYATSTNGTWTAVSTATNRLTAFEMTATENYADGDATTALLPGTGSFVAGRCVEYPTNSAASVTLDGNRCSNLEYCFRATGKAPGGTTYYFRVTGPTTYSAYAVLTMAAGNEPPQLLGPFSANVSTRAGFTNVLTATGGEPIAYRATGLPASLSFDGTNRILGLATTPGVYEVGLTASNAWGFDAETLTISVMTNVPPVANNQQAALAEGAEKVIDLAWSDADTPEVTHQAFTILSGPSHGVFESKDLRDGTVGYNDQYYYRADVGYSGPDSFTWKCADIGGGESDIATCSITIRTNTAPVVTGSGTQLHYCYTDPDEGQTFEIEIVSAPSHGRIIGTTYCRDWGYWGGDCFTWRVCDGVATSDIGTVTLTASEQAPQASRQGIFGLKNMPAAVPIHYTAGTGHDIVAIKTQPGNGTVEIVGNEFHYTPDSDYVGRDSFAWTVTNEYATGEVGAECVVHIFEDESWLVQKQDIAKVGRSKKFGMFYAPWSGSVSFVTGPDHGTVKATGAEFIYTPDAGYEGPDRFVWEADESMGMTNRAVCELMVREPTNRAGMMVLLAVDNDLLPQITNEVARLKQDLENEGYTSKIVGEPPPNYKLSGLERLWWHLKREYSVEDQMMAGAILLGYMPHADPVDDLNLWNMESFTWGGEGTAYTVPSQIWVSRVSAGGAVGRGFGTEVQLMKRFLQANHDYRTGASRLPHSALLYAATPEFDHWEVELPFMGRTWPEAMRLPRPVDAFAAGCDFFDELSHGNFLEYGLGDAGYTDCRTLFNSVCQARVIWCHSCSVGGFNGILEQHLFTRSGGAMMSMWNPHGPSSPGLLGRLKSRDSWGAAFADWGNFGWLRGSAWYGDFSLPPMMHPHNDMPVIDSVTADVTSGPAPLAVTLTCAASDPDGQVAQYEWFVDGYDYGKNEPAYVTGGTAPSLNHIYALPHCYQARVQAIDNYKAVTYKLGPVINVAPQPGEPVRVNCGYKTGHYTPGADYTDTNGCLWLHDQLYADGTWGHSLSSGQGGSSGQDVIGTDDDLLYQYWRRRSSEIPYRVPASNGDYTLRLGFADMTSTSALQRVMDIDVEGTNRVTGLDVFAEVGSKTVKVVELAVTVSDGELNFTVRKNAGATVEAILNCFELTPVGWTPEPPEITSSLTAAATDSAPFCYTITASGSQPIAYGASGLPEGLRLTGSAIGGTPTCSGVFSVTLTATNVAGTDTEILELTVGGDFDGDGIPDGTDPDDDNDGMSDVDEAEAGTNPLDPESRFKVSGVTCQEGDVGVSFDSVGGRVYGVYYKDDLLIGQWVPLQTNIAGTGSPILFTDSTAGARRFYRLKVRLP